MDARKVKYDTVAFAASQIRQLGRIPNTELVAEHLGTENKALVERLLKKWFAEQKTHFEEKKAKP